MIWKITSKMRGNTIHVLHICRSPLVGSPIRICTALNAHTHVKARLVVYDPDAYGSRAFDQDLTWNEDKEQVIELAHSADILHLHNEIDLDSTIFSPINFRQLLKQGKRLIRQFHSVPALVSRNSIFTGSPSKSETDILNCPIPKLVIAQFQERFYPTARLVPNIVPFEEWNSLRQKTNGAVRIFYNPSNIFPAWDVRWGTRRSPWEMRWGTKGFPETNQMLKRVEKYFNKTNKKYPKVVLEIHKKLLHKESMALNRMCQISIDELVTGSYHQASLESLALGHPTLCYLDSRIQQVLFEFTGCTKLPWVSVRLEDAEQALIPLIEDAELRDAIGKYSFEWMNTYWKDRDLVRHFVKAYEDLLTCPEVFQIPRFDVKDKKAMWFVQGFDDALWNSREKRFSSFLQRHISYRHPPST